MPHYPPPGQMDSTLGYMWSGMTLHGLEGLAPAPVDSPARSTAGFPKKRLAIASVLCVLGLCCATPGMAVSKTELFFQATANAARKGDAAAQLKLGEMYDLGEGVPRDYKEAVKWYRLSAEQGNPAARFALAEMYKNGDGVSKDIQTAIKW